MTVFRRCLSALASVLVVVTALSATALAADVQVRSGLDVEETLLGDAVGFTIIVDGVDAATGPDTDAFGEDFDARFVGGRPSRRTEIVTVRGQTSRRHELSYTMVYALTPRRAGELRVPALTLDVEGREYTTPARVLRVIGPQATPLADMALTFAPQRVYVEQPVEFVLTVTLQRAVLEDGWYEGDPWIPLRPPELRVPWFEELEGFIASDPREFMGALLAGAGETGFRVNGIAQRALLGSPEALRFKLHRSGELRAGRGFYRYQLRKRLIPTETGSFEIPIATLHGETIQSLARRRGQLQAEDTQAVFIAHEPVVLDVLPVPIDSAPPTYSHAVGRYRITADVQPRRVKVGDPMNLTLTVTGMGRLDRIAAPRLANQADLVADFQVADGDPPHTDGSGRAFSFTLRPLRTGIARVPGIKFAAFDPETESFVTSVSDALTIEVEAAQAVSASEVEISDGGRPVESTPGEELQGGLLGNYGDEDTLEDESSDPQSRSSTWALIALPPLLFAGALLLARRRDAHSSDPHARRARTALARATARLDTARGALERGAPREAASALHDALADYVADRTRRAAGTLTAADVAEILASVNAQEAASEIVAALRACEALRFGGTSSELPDRVDAAAGWLRGLERERWS